MSPALFAVLSKFRELTRLIHTGQHYDFNMCVLKGIAFTKPLQSRWVPELTQLKQPQS